MHRINYGYLVRIRVRVRHRVSVRVRVRLGIGLGLGFRSGQSQCVPPFRSGNYTNPQENDRTGGKLSFLQPRYLGRHFSVLNHDSVMHFQRPRQYARHYRPMSFCVPYQGSELDTSQRFLSSCFPFSCQPVQILKSDSGIMT